MASTVHELITNTFSVCALFVDSHFQCIQAQGTEPNMSAPPEHKEQGMHQLHMHFSSFMQNFSYVSVML
jgi:hypothetical protein